MEQENHFEDSLLTCVFSGFSVIKGSFSWGQGGLCQSNNKQTFQNASLCRSPVKHGDGMESGRDIGAEVR